MGASLAQAGNPTRGGFAGLVHDFPNGRPFRGTSQRPESIGPCRPEPLNRRPQRPTFPAGPPTSRAAGSSATWGTGDHDRERPSSTSQGDEPSPGIHATAAVGGRATHLPARRARVASRPHRRSLDDRADAPLSGLPRPGPRELARVQVLRRGARGRADRGNRRPERTGRARSGAGVAARRRLSTRPRRHLRSPDGTTGRIGRTTPTSRYRPPALSRTCHHRPVRTDRPPPPQEPVAELPSPPGPAERPATVRDVARRLARRLVRLGRVRSGATGRLVGSADRRAAPADPWCLAGGRARAGRPRDLRVLPAGRTGRAEPSWRAGPRRRNRVGVARRTGPGCRDTRPTRGPPASSRPRGTPNPTRAARRSPARLARPPPATRVPGIGSRASSRRPTRHRCSAIVVGARHSPGWRPPVRPRRSSHHPSTSRSTTTRSSGAEEPPSTGADLVASPPPSVTWEGVRRRLGCARGAGGQAEGAVGPFP